ncbi:glyoxal reductase [Nitzschia inconspicua]|uniref:Glyoxal reductase n=1 Tax=Nitzschia inconspicua TaxID=303405 RepID=A0A9K3L4E6_9STRA|nr:glyoxal reductase [Nitzschia inconspicua]
MVPQAVASPTERGGEPSYIVAVESTHRPHLDANTGSAVTVTIPALCFGLYKVPNDLEGEQIVLNAIDEAGYRSLDSAPIYGNEETVGNALAKCTSVGRSDLFIASKVWNDAQRRGRSAVRESVEKSLQDLQCNYLDICYVHWPVPEHFVETYKELQLLQNEGKIRYLGISNFNVEEYERLTGSDGVSIKPLIHQFEISPFMYRPERIKYFQDKGILLAASKALHRATDLDKGVSAVGAIADNHGISAAQVLLRWSLQKGFMPLSKTSKLDRMRQNRDIFGLNLSKSEIEILDSLTEDSSIRSREERELESKNW